MSYTIPISFINLKIRTMKYSMFLKGLFIAGLSIMCFSCEEESNQTTTDCPEMEISFNDELGLYEAAFIEESNIDSWLVEWLVDGQLVSGGLILDYVLDQAGTYEVCVGYETPECPQGYSLCETITVEGGGNEPDPSDDCPEMELVYVQGENTHQFNVIFPGEPTTVPDYVEWFVNNEVVSVGYVLDYTFTQAGTYEVCAAYETAECPWGFSVCQTITVEDNGNDPDPVEGCPEMEISFNEELGLYEAAFIEESNIESWIVEWFVDGQLVSGGLILEYVLDQTGTYQVCVGYETPECPQGYSLCESITIE